MRWTQQHAEIPVFAVALYLLVVFYGPLLMAKRQPIRLRALFAAWNLLLAVFSAIGMFKVVPRLLSALAEQGLTFTVCHDPHKWYADGAPGLWTTLFIYSKVFLSLF